MDAQAQRPPLHVKDPPPPQRTHTWEHIINNCRLIDPRPQTYGEGGVLSTFFTCKNVQKMGAALLYSDMCDLLVVILGQCRTVRCIFNISV